MIRAAGFGVAAAPALALWLLAATPVAAQDGFGGGTSSPRAATRAAPDGMFRRPRNSTLTPAIQRRPKRAVLAHSLTTPMANRCGIKSAGDRPMAKIGIDR